jgi:hypothetical protein
MEINMKRFKFIEHTRKDTGVKEVIALTHYCGETVKGVASCSPVDTYDFEVGKKLAALRCNMKIADKRITKAYAEEFEVMEELDRLLKKRKKIQERTAYAAEQYEEAVEELRNYYESLA